VDGAQEDKRKEKRKEFLRQMRDRKKILNGGRPIAHMSDVTTESDLMAMFQSPDRFKPLVEGPSVQFNTLMVGGERVDSFLTLLHRYHDVVTQQSLTANTVFTIPSVKYTVGAMDGFNRIVRSFHSCSGSVRFKLQFWLPSGAGGDLWRISIFNYTVPTSVANTGDTTTSLSDFGDSGKIEICATSTYKEVEVEVPWYTIWPWMDAKYIYNANIYAGPQLGVISNLLCNMSVYLSAGDDFSLNWPLGVMSLGELKTGPIRPLAHMADLSQLQAVTEFVETKEQLTVFKDTIGKSESTLPAINGFWSKFNGDPYLDQTPVAKLTRAYEISSFVWSGASATGTMIQQFNFPNDLVGVSVQLQDTLAYATYLRAGTKVIIKVNATDRHYGCLAVVWVPNYAPITSSNCVQSMTNALSGNECSFLSANSPSSVEFTIPYMYAEAYWNMARDAMASTFLNGFGIMRIYVLHPLSVQGSAATPTLSVGIWACFDQPKIAGPGTQTSVFFSAEEEEDDFNLDDYDPNNNSAMVATDHNRHFFTKNKQQVETKSMKDVFTGKREV